MSAALLVIGNEILTGQTPDENINFVAKRLLNLGIELLEVRIVPDKQEAITHNILQLSSCYKYLFTTGGIGPTHDDITVQTIARTFNVPLEQSLEAKEVIKKYHNPQFNEDILVPQGCTLLFDPICHYPFFSFKNVFVLAGSPHIMQKMFLAVEPFLKKGPVIYMNQVKTCLSESKISKPLNEIQERYLDVDIGSYPFYNNMEEIGTNIVVKGKKHTQVKVATQRIVDIIKDQQGSFKLIENLQERLFETTNNTKL